MTLSERMQIAGDIARAQLLLESLKARNSKGGRQAKEKDTADWLAVRQICTQQVARMQLLGGANPSAGAAAQLPLEETIKAFTEEVHSLHSPDSV